jgi:hypothetical protein
VIVDKQLALAYLRENTPVENAMRGARLLCVLLCGLWGSEAGACSIPVFRYALENWAPSPYRAFVFHKGPLSDAGKSLLHKLQDGPANLTVTVADVAGKLAPEVDKVWRRHAHKEHLPALVVLYPDEEEDADAPPAWSGPLDDSSIHHLLDSPTRRKIVKLLTSGESVVWLLMSDGENGDNETMRLLEKELPRLQGVLQLPEQKDDPDLRSRLPLRISFPVLRLSRTQAEERFLVQSLLGSEEGLRQVSGPILFPIFGRGRGLLALHGETLTAAHLERWASFLCSACSCRVKEANPGVDLLITADWGELLEVAENEAPSKPALTAPAIPPGLSEEEDATTSADKPHSCRCWLWSGVAGGGVVFLVACVWLLRRRVGGSPSGGQMNPRTASTTQQPR